MRSTLAFTDNASRVVAETAAGIEIVDPEGSAPAIAFPVPALEDLATVGDEIWLVERGRVPTLRRIALTGAAIGERFPLWGVPGEGQLRPLVTGHGALWSAAPPAVISIDADRVTSTPIPGTPDLVLPVSATRWLVCRDHRVALREPTTERWSTDGLGIDRVIDGAILFDGRSAALRASATGRDGAPAEQLLVIGLRDAVVQHRLTLSHAEAVRFAPARGFALVLVARRRLLLLDLRFGRVVREHLWHRDIDDLAIDPAAQQIVLRHGRNADDIVHVAVRNLGGAQPVSDDEPPIADAEPAVEAVMERAPARALEPPTEPKRERAPFHEGPALESISWLGPRPDIAQTTPAEARTLLDSYRGLVTALAGRAIAHAWDRGLITYPNEGALPFRSEVDGLLGRNANRAAAELRAAEQQVVDAIGGLRAAEKKIAPRIPPIGALANQFELSPLARQILLVVAAPALWGDLARLYGILANDEGRPLCDELLVSQILGVSVDAHQVARELDRSAPLVRYGILIPGEGRMRPFVALTVEPLVLRVLRGSYAAEDVEGIRLLRGELRFEELLISASVKRKVLELTAPPDGPIRIAVRGRVGSGRHTLLATVAAVAGRGVALIDAAPIVRDLRTRLDQLRTYLKRAQLLGLLPCIDGLETIGSEDQVARDIVREALREHPGPLVVHLPWDSPVESGYATIDLPALSIDDRLTVWQTVLEQHRLYVREPIELASRYSVGPGVVVRACEQVEASVGRDAGNGEPRDVAPELERAVRLHLESRLGTSATRVQRLATWSHVVLPPDIQDSLLELIARIKHRRLVFDVWGFDAVMSTSRGVTALFSGGPGTGKTLVASAIANELGMDLYRVDLSRVMSKWIGETEQNLARLFDAAEDGHAIILFDEADSLFAKRTEVKSSVDRYANLEVNFLLQRLDSFEGIAILTTNFGTAIDAAFKRRLSFRLTFPFPDEEMREQLWRAHLPPDLPVAGVFDLAALARRYRMSGGYIRNATLRAAFLAAEEHVPLTQEHLERAIRAEFREIGKLADSGVLE